MVVRVVGVDINGKGLGGEQMDLSKKARQVSDQLGDWRDEEGWRRGQHQKGEAGPMAE